MDFKIHFYEAIVMDDVRGNALENIFFSWRDFFCGQSSSLSSGGKFSFLKPK